MSDRRRSVTKHDGSFAAVGGVSFEVPEGQLVAPLGPNGAGKTTTLEMLEGFLAPTSGTARALGVDPTTPGRRPARSAAAARGG